MDLTQIAVWAATVAGLAGLAAAFYRSERLRVRLGALGAFAVFYFAVLLWTPTDPVWFNLTTVSILLIAFGSRMRKPAPTGEPSDAAPGDGQAGQADQPDKEGTDR